MPSTCGQAARSAEDAEEILNLVDYCDETSMSQRDGSKHYAQGTHTDSQPQGQSSESSANESNVAASQVSGD